MKQPVIEEVAWRHSKELGRVIIGISADVLSRVSPGVRELVRVLNANGFETTDSGDGSNYAGGMECAVPCPMVAMWIRSQDMVDESYRLMVLLRDMGVEFTDDPNGPSIQASYNPVDQSSVILLTNVLSKDLRTAD